MPNIFKIANLEKLKNFFNFILTIGVAIVFPSYSYSQNDEIAFEVPVYLNKTFQCYTTFKVVANEEYIDIRPILEVIDRLINQDLRDSIPASLQEVPFKPLPIHIGEHIQILFDSTNQSVQIEINPEKLQLNTIDLAEKKTVEPPSINPVYPEKFSSYVNVNISKNFQHYYFSPHSSQSSLFGSTNFSLNFRDWILEGFCYFLNYGTGGKKRLSQQVNRGNIFLLKDFVQEDKRFMLGDISPDRVSFQNSAPLFGLQMTHNPAIFGKMDPNIGPVGQYEFFLNAPSKVEVYVNEVFIRTLDLPAGAQRIKNFPYADGVNTVDLVISDPTGTIKTLNLNAFFTSKLLRKGRSFYSASVGFPRFQETSQRYQYLFTKPACSACFSRGFTDTVTGNFYIQATPNSLFSGGDILHANRFFYLESALGLSYSPSHLAGLREKISVKNAPNRGPISWTVTMDFFSKYFANFLSAERVNNQKCFFSGSVRLPVGKMINTSVQGFYGISRNNIASNWSTSWNLATRLKKGVSLNLLTSYKKLGIRKKFLEMVLSLSVGPFANTNFRANYNSRTQVGNVYGSYSKTLSKNRSIQTNIGYTYADGRNEATGSFSYQGAKGSLYVDHYLYQNTLFASSANPSIAATTRINGSTSFVFADKTLAISKPVSQGFAIIQPKKELISYPIDVYTGAYGEPVSSSFKHLAAVAPIPSYQRTKIFIDSQDLPIGYDLGTTVYTLQSKYKSGFKITVGGAGRSYYAEGFLNDQDRNPLPYKNITVINKQGEEEQINVITNAQGKFFLYYIPEGSYTLAIDGLEHLPIKIEIIGNDTEEMIYLGKIYVEVTNKEEDELTLE